MIKIERPEGDFARGYDRLAHGESAYFVWLNRGKESVVLDLSQDADKALLENMLAKADVFIQNLKPGAVAKLGFAIERLRRDYPRLICCSVSGFGETGPYATRKSYDLLVQAESGLASVTGGPEAPARVGVSVTDIASGMNAYEAVLEAHHRARPHRRRRSDSGVAVRRHGGLDDGAAAASRGRLLAASGSASPHPSIAPYGVFKTRDGADILISIQNDREWRVLAEKVMGDAALAADPQFATVTERMKRRPETDGKVAAMFATMDVGAAVGKARSRRHRLRTRQRCRRASSRHPHLRRISVETPSGPVSYPAPAAIRDQPRHYGRVPSLGEHTEKVRKEFG